MARRKPTDLFWLCAALAAPSILLAVLFGLYGSVLTLLLLASWLRDFPDLVSWPSPDADVSAILFMVVFFASGPLGLTALSLLARLICAVRREGLEGLDRRRRTIAWGYALGTVPFCFWLVLSLVLSIAMEIFSVVFMLPLLMLIAVRAIRGARTPPAASPPFSPNR